MNSYNILDGKPPSPINKIENNNNLTLEEENNVLHLWTFKTPIIYSFLILFSA